MSIFGSTTEVADREAKQKIYGVVIGIVTKNNDPDGTGYRVKVRFPFLEHGGEGEGPADESNWARVASFMAGEHISGAGNGPRGAYFLPEVDDEVLVAFEHGDISRPIVIGMLWSAVGDSGGDSNASHPVYSNSSGKGKLALAADGEGGPHNKTSHSAGSNDLSGIRTRSGHLLVFNDNAEGGIYLRTTKNHRLEIVDGGKQGIVLADPDGNHVWLKSGSASGDIEIVTNGNILLDAKQDITLKAGGAIKTQSGSDTTMKVGAAFQMSSGGQMTLKSGATGTVQAASTLTLTAPRINLN